MGKKWDSDKGGVEEWIAWLSSVLAECRRVLKPGGALLCWAIPRTSHWTGMAIERAGYRIFDVVVHCHGQGFPKSLDISKKMDEMAGAEREIVGNRVRLGDKKAYPIHNREYDGWGFSDINKLGEITAPATDEAKLWQGWGTSLAPSVEFWWLAYNPREGTYCQNAMRYGVAGLNIDGARIPSGGEHKREYQPSNNERTTYHVQAGFMPTNKDGRWPSDLILSCACESIEWCNCE